MALPTDPDLVLDHLVIGTPDLARTVAAFHAATGIEPVFGGNHPGRGTRNYLVGLGERQYLELIGINPDDPVAEADLFFGLGDCTEPEFRTWAVRTDDLDRAIPTLRAAGLLVGEPMTGSRGLPDGSVLNWRLTDPLPEPTGIHPFLIEWGDSHPASSGSLPEVELVRLIVRHPQAAEFERSLRTAGLQIDVDPGPPEAAATIRTPKGTITLDRDLLSRLR